MVRPNLIKNWINTKNTMTMKKINYLRSCRKQTGLSQQDVSFLIGKTSVSIISKMEDNLIFPDLKTTFHLSLLYQKSIIKLFAKLFEDCSFSLLRKIDCLSSEFSKRNSDTSIGKNEEKKNILKKDFLEKVAVDIKKNNA